MKTIENPTLKRIVILDRKTRIWSSPSADSVLARCSLCPRWLKGVDMERKNGDFFHLLDLPGFPVGKPVRRVLIAGARPESLTIYLSAFAAVQGFDVLVADGANAFDPYV